MSSIGALGDAHAMIGTMTSDQLLPNSTSSFTCCLQFPVTKVTIDDFGACHNYVYSLQAIKHTIGISSKVTEIMFLTNFVRTSFLIQFTV